MDSYSQSVISRESSICLASCRRLTASEDPAGAALAGAWLICMPPGAGAQFLQLPDTALLAPGLILGLTDPVHGLRLFLAQPIDVNQPGAGLGIDGQIRRLVGANHQFGGRRCPPAD